MMTKRFIQVVGNMVVRELSERYPDLLIVFFANHRGDTMRVMIANKEDARYTGHLYDVGENPGLVTLSVRELSAKMQQRIEGHVRTFLQSQSKAAQ